MHSQRATPSTPSREIRTQPVSLQIEHMAAFYMGKKPQEAQKAHVLFVPLVVFLS
jgi:hypothetical protein